MSAIARQCLENGVDRADGRNLRQRVRLLPPINIDEALLDDGLDVLEAAIIAASA